MSKPRFLLDEHVNRATQRQLRRWNPMLEVLGVGDQGAPPPGTSDPDILRWIEASRHILVPHYVPTTLPQCRDPGYEEGRD